MQVRNFLQIYDYLLKKYYFIPTILPLCCTFANGMRFAKTLAF